MLGVHSPPLLAYQTMTKVQGPINSKAVIAYCYKDKSYAKALELAKKLYKKVKRAYTGVEYLSHPLTVGSLLLELGVSSEAMQASALQDTVEKTTLKATTVRTEFGDAVSDLVNALTPVTTPDGMVDIAAYTAAIVAAGVEAQTIKLASILDDVCSIPANKLSAEAERIGVLATIAAGLTGGNAELARRVQAAVRRARA